MPNNVCQPMIMISQWTLMSLLALVPQFHLMISQCWTLMSPLALVPQ
jgi:hypothetical protein